MAKKTYCISFLFLLLFLFSCTTREERELSAMLDRADSLAESNPDSALAILSQIVLSIGKEGSGVVAKSLRMRYALLRVKIDDKHYRPITSYEHLVTDTLLPYFRHHDSKWLPTALFYAGRICADKGDAPQAIDYYQQTLDALPEGDNDRSRGLVHIQIGWLFLYQELYEEAISHLKHAYQCELEAKDSIYMAHTLQAIGTCYLKTNSEDSAYVYFNKALTMALQGGNDYVKNEALEQMAHISIWKKDFQKARAYLNMTLGSKDSSTIHVAYTVAVMLHYEQNHSDSVLFYAHKLLKVGNIYNRYTAYKALASIYLKKGQPELALEYQNKWEECDDSIRKQKNTETLARMHSLYNYQLREKENTKLIQEKNRQKLILIISFFSFITIILMLIVIILRIKEQKRRIQDRLEQIQKLQYRESIIRKEQSGEIIALSSEDNLKSLHERLLNSSIAIQFYERIQTETIPKEEDWTKLEQEVSKTFPYFKRTLYRLYPLKEQEFRICLLLKIQMRNKDVAQLISRTHNAITMASNRLIKKMFGKEECPYKDLRELVLAVGAEYGLCM
ncbi:MAG: tetratricopeptide repeat protein [Prevotella sp.]|nr:tetratricopeptide repeat protein [Prevotella sp.]